MALRTRGPEVVRGALSCEVCGGSYPIAGGIPDLLPPSLVGAEDLRWMAEYDRMARSYYMLMHVVIPVLSFWTEPLARSRWASRLGLRPGDRVLDVGTGTGRNLPFLRRLVGPEGLVVGMDISTGMLYYALRLVRRKNWGNVELQRATASYLPYKDGVFDAVIQVGGMNTFEEKARALSEMLRVVKPGGKVLIVDEGLEPRKRRTLRGKLLLRSNLLYASYPPIEELPDGVEGLHVEWGVIPCWALPMWPFYILELRRSG